VRDFIWPLYELSSEKKYHFAQTEIYVDNMFLNSYVLCTVHCDVIIQYKPKKCTIF